MPTIYPRPWRREVVAFPSLRKGGKGPAPLAKRSLPSPPRPGSRTRGCPCPSSPPFAKRGRKDMGSRRSGALAAQSFSSLGELEIGRGDQRLEECLHLE